IRGPPPNLSICLPRVPRLRSRPLAMHEYADRVGALSQPQIVPVQVGTSRRIRGQATHLRRLPHHQEGPMKIVIIGGTGLIGSKTVPILRQSGPEVVAPPPHTGVNTIPGQGLKEAMVGTQVVIDLANSPSFEDKAVLEFFET